MAGHSKFKNIMYRKGAQDKKRGKIFTKIIKEIAVAVKIDGPDANSNPRLRSALALARTSNMPKDNIERAIKKASEGSDGSNYESIRYEGYGHGGIAVVVEVLTDNRNRAASEVRTCFSKNGGNLGESGSVSFMFNHCGIIRYSNDNLDLEKVFEIAAAAGADDVVEEDGFIVVISSVSAFHKLQDVLLEKLGEAKEAKIEWRPNALVEIDEEQYKKILKLLDALEDCDDVQDVFANFDVSDEVAEKVHNA